MESFQWGVRDMRVLNPDQIRSGRIPRVLMKTPAGRIAQEQRLEQEVWSNDDSFNASPWSASPCRCSRRGREPLPVR